MAIRIMSLGHAIADKVVMAMDQWVDHLGYKSPSIRRLARRSQVKVKRWWIDPVGKSVQELSEAYIEGSLKLSCEAIVQCVGPRSYGDIGSLIYVSTTQQLQVCPSMAFRIAGELELAPDIQLVDIIGDGCQGAVPGLETAFAHVNTFKAPALVVSTEICSATFYPAPEKDLGNTISNFIFNDGSAALLLEHSEDPQYPAVLDFTRKYSKEGKDLLGYIHQDGRQKVVLSREVPKKVSPMVAQVVRKLLDRNQLAIGDISNWCIHNGGVAILDEIAGLLEMDSEREFRYSWEVLREYGNLSSATIGVVAQLMHQDPANRHGYVLGCAMGAGAQVSAVLCKYGP